LEEHARLTESLTNVTNTSRSALDAARHQQTFVDDLLDTVNSSRRLADRAVDDAERTLADAEQTLSTLRGRASSSSFYLFSCCRKIMQ